MAALMRSGARNASEIVMLTLRTLQFSRCAIASTVIAGSVMSSLNHRRPFEIEAIRSARFSDRIGRAGGEEGVREVIRNYRADFDLTLALSGMTSAREVGPHNVTRV